MKSDTILVTGATGIAVNFYYICLACPALRYLELSASMKTKGGPQYVVSAISFNGNR